MPLSKRVPLWVLNGCGGRLVWMESKMKLFALIPRAAFRTPEVWDLWEPLVKPHQ